MFWPAASRPRLCGGCCPAWPAPPVVSPGFLGVGPVHLLEWRELAAGPGPAEAEGTDGGTHSEAGALALGSSRPPAGGPPWEDGGHILILSRKQLLLLDTVRVSPALLPSLLSTCLLAAGSCVHVEAPCSPGAHSQPCCLPRPRIP